jgi:pyrroline-5-carboxylate reductase
MKDFKVGFIGGGNMTSAIVGGVVKAKTFPPEQMYVFDIHDDKRENLRKKTGINIQNSAGSLVKTCDIVFLAVKPQSFPSMLESIRPYVDEEKTLVSIAAGISADSITQALACRCPVIRAMPNTPLLMGEGATAVCKTENVDNDVYQLVLKLFSSCGIVAQIKESQMNAVISVNGSSPAYVYLLAKAVFASAFLFVFACFLCGLSIWGMFLIPFIPFFRGFGLGLTAGYLYACYGGKGVLFTFIVILPGAYICCLAILLAARNGIGFSHLLASLNSNKVNHTKLKIYTLRFGVALGIVFLASLIDLLLSVCFGGLFSF